MPYALEHGDIAGAAVVVVKSGAVIPGRGPAAAARFPRPSPASRDRRRGSLLAIR
ncbi:MAG TPA: hypothetical protein VMW75_10645 [Thermoanaerobaculia bacterium]|nr:hypothetical protein [Thermoanaerobaculia bacterium]